MSEKNSNADRRGWFRKFAAWSASGVGSPWAFAAGVFVIVLWAILGPVFHYSDTWQLVINTGTTIITFLIVFLIQNTQNRDGRAIQLKLDELIRAHQGARNHLVELEDCTDEELQHLKSEFQKLRSESRTANSQTQAAGGGEEEARAAMTATAQHTGEQS